MDTFANCGSLKIPTVRKSFSAMSGEVLPVKLDAIPTYLARSSLLIFEPWPPGGEITGVIDAVVVTDTMLELLISAVVIL